MKKAIFSMVFTLVSAILFAQVEKTILVEHFTNTRCGVCASKNPGFYNNLANHPHVLHLAIHPSSPYSNCALHLENPTENDGRTNFYEVYGGTPRLVIQGEPQSFSVDFSSPTIFDPYEGHTTPLELKIKEYRIGSDSVRAEVTVKAVSSHSLEGASLFLACAEDTVFYQAPNGENQHYDVFRKAFTPVDGKVISLPSAGDSVVMNYALAIEEGWDPARISVIGVIQDSGTKEVIQAGQTSSVEYLSSIFNPRQDEMVTLPFYPNPATSVITLKDVTGLVGIYTMEGRLLMQTDAGERKTDLAIDISFLDAGHYIIRNINRSNLLLVQ